MTKTQPTTTPVAAEKPPALLLEEVLVVILRDVKLSLKDREALERAVFIARTLQKASTSPPVAPI
jgi:hypothetical protein